VGRGAAIARGDVRPDQETVGALSVGIHADRLCGVTGSQRGIAPGDPDLAEALEVTQARSGSPGAMPRWLPVTPQRRSAWIPTERAPTVS